PSVRAGTRHHQRRAQRFWETGRRLPNIQRKNSVLKILILQRSHLVSERLPLLIRPVDLFPVRADDLLNRRRDNVVKDRRLIEAENLVGLVILAGRVRGLRVRPFLARQGAEREHHGRVAHLLLKRGNFPRNLGEWPASHALIRAGRLAQLLALHFQRLPLGALLKIKTQLDALSRALNRKRQLRLTVLWFLLSHCFSLLPFHLFSIPRRVGRGSAHRRKARYNPAPVMQARRTMP